MDGERTIGSCLEAEKMIGNNNTAFSETRVQQNRQQ